MNPTQELGKYIKSERKAKGMTLEDVEAKGGVDKGLLSRIEHGNCNPSFLTLLQVSKGLKLSFALGQFER